MKKLLFLLTLTLASLTTHATGYESDIIYIDGTQWELLGRPVYADTTLLHNLKVVLPKDRTIRSSNWDGFTTYWTIQLGKLCLDSIQYEVYDSSTKKTWAESLPLDTLRRVFNKYVEGNRIVATWFTNDIRLAKGKIIWYQHTFFERNYENEQIISIAQGKVTKKQEFHNYKTEGFSFDQVRDYDFPKTLKEKFHINAENYPELADAKRILISIRKARVDEKGNLVECEVSVHKPYDNERLAAEISEALKAYHPWRVMYINGEYRAYGIEHWTFPLKMPKDSH